MNIGELRLSAVTEGYPNTTTNISLAGSFPTNFLIALHPGFKVQGRVVSESLQPVSGAKISRIMGPVTFEVKSGDDGKFLSPDILPGNIRLLARADGYQQIITNLVMQNGDLELDLVLTKGLLMSGRVVDQEGKPVAKVAVYASSGPFDTDQLDLDTMTDAEGRFRWNSAPSKPVPLQFHATGYNGGGDNLSGQLNVWKPTSEEQTFTISKVGEIKLSGIVTDAETGEAIPSFRVHLEEEHVGTFGLPPLGAGENGQFLITTQISGKGFGSPFVRISADGYAALASESFSPTLTQKTFDFKLTKDAGIRGKVFDSTGLAVSAATLRLVSQFEFAQLNSSFAFTQSSAPGQAISDNEGSFLFRERRAAIGMVVLHEKGFKYVPLSDQKNLEITLDSLASAEVKVVLSGKPVAGQLVNIIYQTEFGAFSAYLQGTTDADGVVLFQKVLPLESLVCISVSSLKGKGNLMSHTKLVVLKPGELNRIQLGGSGRLVRGRLQASENEKIDWTTVMGSLRLQIGPPDPSPPRGRDLTMAEQYRDPSFGFAVEANGEFIIRDVTHAEKSRLSISGTGEARFYYSQQVTLPDGNSDVDLGVIDVTGKIQRPNFR